jgi:hypothetical protein
MGAPDRRLQQASKALSSDVAMEPRPLTSRERAILDLLLAADFPAAEALREQAKAVEVIGICGCGCPSIDFVTGRGLGMSTRVNAVHNGSNDGLFLWTIEEESLGELLGGIEWVGVSDSDPEELPDPAEITVTDWW